MLAVIIRQLSRQPIIFTYKPQPCVLKFFGSCRSRWAGTCALQQDLPVIIPQLPTQIANFMLEVRHLLPDYSAAADPDACDLVRDAIVSFMISRQLPKQPTNFTFEVRHLLCDCSAAADSARQLRVLNLLCNGQLSIQPRNVDY